MTPQIIKDLNRVCDPHPKNSYLLSPVIRKIVGLYTRATRDEVEAEIRQHCEVTDSPSGPVLRGWCLRRGQAV